MSRVKSALLGSISAQFFLIVTMLISIVTTPLFLRYLSSEEYGASIILFQIILYLSVFDFGLGAAITRQLAQYRDLNEENRYEINRVISTSFYVFLILGILVIVTGLWLSSNIYRFFTVSGTLKGKIEPIVLTLAIFLGLQFPIKVFSSIFYAHQKQLLSNLLAFYVSIINTIITLVFLMFHFGLWSFVYANIVTTVFNVVITFYYIKKYYKFIVVKFKLFDRLILKQLFDYGFFIFINSIAVQIVFYTDRVVIGSLISLASVTAFSLTSRVPELSMQLIFKVTQSTFPALVEINNEERNTKLSLHYTRLMLLTISLIMIAFWMILSFNKIFIDLWVGHDYYAGNVILVLSLLIMVTQCSVYVHATCLNSAGKVRGLSFVSIIEAAINIWLSIWLCQKIGMYGALLGTIIASLVSSSWYSPYHNMKYLNLSFKDFFIKPILIPIVSISVLGGVIYMIVIYILKYYNFNWFSLITSVAVTGIAMSLFVWIVFLKSVFKDYIPPKYKKILFS